MTQRNLTSSVWATLPTHSHTLSIDTDLTINSELLDTQTTKILGMILLGVDPDENKEEYLQVIRRIPSVKDDNLKILVIYDRVRKLHKILDRK